MYDTRHFLVRMLEAMIERRRQAAKRRADAYLEALGLYDHHERR